MIEYYWITNHFDRSHTSSEEGNSRPARSIFRSRQVVSVVPFLIFTNWYFSTPLEPPRQDQSLRARTEASELPASDDPRFEIAITAPDNSIAHFKTRGKHPVRKVLAAACKTFGIKYERSVT